MPVGVDGTARFVQDVAEEAGSRTSEVVRARSVWEDLGPLRNRIRGKRIFFAGDTGLEIPLARFLADAGAVVLEVGAPRLDRRFLAAELQALGPDVDVVVSPDYRGQLNRIEESRPDVVISSPVSPVKKILFPLMRFLRTPKSSHTDLARTTSLIRDPASSATS